MNILRKLTLAAVIGLSGIAAAQAHSVVTPRERAELRRDTREVERQRHDLARARLALRHAEHSRDPHAIRLARRDVAREHRALQRARLERQRDRWHAHR